MPPTIQFSVPGDPKAQKRHRHSVMKMGNKVFSKTYDPHKDEKANFLLKCMDNRPENPFTTPIKLELDFYFPRPKSHYGTGKNITVRKKSAPDHHIIRPDVDNLVKFVMDGLAGVYWSNDTIVCDLVARKHWAVVPRTEVKIWELK